MKKGFIFLSFSLWVTLSSFSLQNGEDTLHLLGWVIKDDKPMRKASVGIWLNNELIYQTHTNRWGHFSVDMPLEKNYILTFSADGHITKRIAVDTRTSSLYNAGEYMFFEFEVDMFEEAPWILNSLFDDPVAIVYYDSYEHLFGYDQQYYAYFQARFEEMRNPGVIIPAVSYMASLGEISGHTVSARTSQQEDIVQEPLVGFSMGQNLFYNSMTHDDLMEPEIFSVQIAQLSTEELPDYQPAGNRGRNSSDRTTVAWAPLLQDHPVAENPSVRHERSVSTSIQTKGGFPDAGQVVKRGVVFSVQVLATTQPIAANYFSRLESRFPGVEIMYFRDEDNLDKYAVGAFANLDQAIEKLWMLRSLHYETYIIAFKDGKKVRVKEALASL